VRALDVPALRSAGVAAVTALVALVSGCDGARPPPAKTAASHEPIRDPSAVVPGSAPAAPASIRTPPELTERTFRRFADGRRAEVQRCYEAVLQKNPAARGKIMARFTILPAGTVDGVEIARSTFRGDELPRCVVEVLRRWTTPFRPDEPVGVEYPFSFAPPQ
jgi:TonB family protein